MNLDSKDFDGKAYLDEVLKQCTHKELISKSSQMKGEILQLDSDMQTLVYDNYNKFISATDTIRSMKSHVRDMETEMRSLQNNMNEISKSNDEISDRLNPRRVKIEELCGVHRLVRRLQFVFEVPELLRKCIEVGAFESAVRHYRLVAPILAGQSSLKAFEEIIVDCQAAVEEMKKCIFDIAENASDDEKDRKESDGSTKLRSDDAFALLLQLDVPAIDVYRLFIQRHFRKISKNILSSSSSSPSLSFLEQVRDMCASYFPHFAKFLEIRHSLFSSAPLDELRAEVRFLNKKESSSSSVLLPSEESIVSIFGNALINLSTSTLGGSIVQIQDFLSACAYIRRGFEQIVRGDQFFAIQGIQMIENVITERMTRDTLKSKDEVMKCIEKMKTVLSSTSTSSSSSSSSSTTTTTQEHLVLNSRTAKAASDCLLEVIGMFVHASCIPVFGTISECVSPGSVDDVLSMVTMQLNNLLVFILESLQKMKELASFAPRSPLLLLLSRGAFVISENLQTNVFEPLAQSVSGGTKGSLEHINSQYFITSFAQMSSYLLLEYIKAEGRQLSRIIRTGMSPDSSFNAEYPRGVKAAYVLVFKTVSNANSDVSLVFPDRSGGGGGGSSHGSSSRLAALPNLQPTAAGGPRTGRTVLSDVARLFEKRINYFEVVEAKRQSITLGIIKIVIKTLIENVRLCSFNKEGYMQMQVDTHFLRIAFRVLVEDDKVLDNLLTEVLHSVADRCYDPESFQMSVIEHLCSKQFGSLGITYRDFTVI